MKAISLWQPWASAIALGAKRVETRSWSTNYRGPLAIHAAKRLIQDELIECSCCWNWTGALWPTGFGLCPGGDKLKQPWDFIPFGAIVAICRLVDCRPTGSFTGDELDAPRSPEGSDSNLYDWTERQMGDFSRGRFGWLLNDIVPLATPIPWKGSQGFFEVPDSVFSPAEATIPCNAIAAVAADERAEELARAQFDEQNEGERFDSDFDGGVK